MPSHDVASTLRRRYIYVMCLPGVVQSIVSLTSSLVVKMLTVLVSTISNSQVFLLKSVSSLCKSYSHFFSKNISVYAIFNDQSFNNTLTNNIVSFEQLGSVLLGCTKCLIWSCYVHCEYFRLGSVRTLPQISRTHLLLTSVRKLQLS